ncbi:hypothetical protein PghCCS26_15210 [Paenibacillus glycanilyticus]|uniref:HPP family protein n=1 Tax=Paenibacillus glycanilyticus TaxID=126569 RepID=A0ABQ6NIL8_9BACL|nr:hypothetical protein [Paenibacillus glycanilyticus]GMK44393.1 hypothetical protein PghCCS26_15210 [Paenibacillus glycanilyticus]
MFWEAFKSGRFISAYLLVFLMLAVAVASHQRDILFPEIAGMAMGVMVFPVPHWVKNPVHLWLSPTIGAFIGTSMNFLSMPPLPKIWLGLIIIVILMHVFRVNFGPTIPAALLPIFLGLHNYTFAISTAIFTFVIMAAAFKFRDPNKLSGSDVRKVIDTVIITLILALWIGLAFSTKLNVLIIPPVFALIFELFHTEKFHWKMISPRLSVLTVTAILSVGVYHLMPGSIIGVGVINVLITFILCKLFKTPVPVAFGVSLMPLIVPDWGTWAFPVGVFVTTGFLMCFSAAYRQFTKRHAVLAART